MTGLLWAALATAGPIQVVFSPGAGSFDFDSAMNQSATGQILSATSTVEVAVYSLTDRGPGSVSEALIDRHNALGPGAVRVITDTDGLSNNAVSDLIAAGVPVIDDDGDPDEMHDKFIVVDGQRVWTATANFTDPGFSSQNNVALLIDSGPVAAAYLDEFDEMWAGVF